MKKIKKALFIIVLILIFSVTAFFIGKRIGLNTNISLTNTIIIEEKVSKQTIKKELSASGEIETATTEKLELDNSKYFEMLCVEEDDTVYEGENILEYTNGTYLVAPYDCVIFSTSVPEADEKCTSSNYVEIKSIKDLQTILSISENEIQEVKENQEVEITLSADETKTYTGIITKIDSIGTYSNGGTTFSATVSFSNDGNAKLGMTVSSTIILEKAEDVLAVPINAVTTKDNKNYVTLINDGETEEREVELGIADEDYVQIISGIDENDTVQITTTTTQSTIRDSSNASNERGRGQSGTDMIKLENVTKTFTMGEEKIKALDNINFNVKKGEFVSIIGPSGSGKSTLMNILGLLDVPSYGKYILENIEVSNAAENKLAEIRNNKIGFIFQNFNLLTKLKAFENIQVPLIYKGYSNDKSKIIAYELLKKVGLKGREEHLPMQLSGGQQQRVAIARALSCNPEIILADEPTGALDSRTSMEIMNQLEELNKQGQTIILITHDEKVAKRAKRIVKIADGKLYEEVESD